jgi:hypothetical protein
LRQKENLLYDFFAISLGKKSGKLMLAFRSLTHVTEAGLHSGLGGMEAEITQILRYLSSYSLPACLKKRFLAAYMLHLQKEARHFECNEIFDLIYFIEEDEDAVLQELIFTSDFYF